MNDPSHGNELEVLAEDAAAWDGTVESAHELRERLRGLKAPKGKLSGPAQVLSKLLSSYDKDNVAKLATWLLERPDIAAVAGPFIGDPEPTPAWTPKKPLAWPFDDPLYVDDDLAVKWLAVLAKVPVVVDDRIRAFVRVLWRTRVRATWVPASRAFAAIATRDPGLRDELERSWTRWIGAEWPKSWKAHRLPQAPQGEAASDDARPISAHDGQDGAHIMRHLIHAACAWLANGGDPSAVAPLTAERFASTKLPRGDDSDASVVLLGSLELLGGPERDAVLRELPARVGEAKPGSQALAALRLLAEALPVGHDAQQDAAHEAVIRRLTRVDWRDAAGQGQVDVLLECLTTAKWLASRGEKQGLEALRRLNDGADRAFRLALGEIAPSEVFDDPVVALTERLKILTTPLLRETLLDGQQAPLVAELVELVRHRELAALSWPLIVERALGPDAAKGATAGTLADVGFDDLIVMLARSGFPVALLMRPARMTEAAVLSIAGSEDGVIARQVAVQMERLLRQAADPVARLRLLWQMLRRDPPGETFQQLRLVLRSQGTPMHALVSAIEAIDAIRETSDIEALCQPMKDVTSAAVAVLSAPVVEPRPAETKVAIERLQRMASDVDAALQLRHRMSTAGASPQQGDAAPSLPAVIADGHKLLRDVLLGTSSGRGLVSWAAWLQRAGRGDLTELEEGDLRERVSRKLERLRRAVDTVADAAPVVEDAHQDGVSEATASLREELALLGWPEGLVAERVLGDIVSWSEAQLEAARAARLLSAHVRATIDRGDEDDAVEVAVDPARSALLPATVARSLHRFLLNRLRFGAATQLRRGLVHRVQLPHWIAHLAPLLAGVVGGAFLVLDVGEGWLKLVGDDVGPSLIATIVLTVLGTYGFIFVDLAFGLRSRRARQTESVRGWGRAWRVGLVVAGAWVVALGTSVVLMGTLNQLNDPLELVVTKALLWSCLALFLGVFLGLVLQGRRASREE